MIEVTDLDYCKYMARLFVELEPVKSNIDFIVYHPFTNYAVVAGKNNKPLDIIKSEEDFSEFKKICKERIDKAHNLSDILCLINKSYYLGYIHYVKNGISTKDLTQFFSIFYPRIEQPNMDVNMSKKEIVQLMRECGQENLVKEYKTEFDQLPDTVKMYRGVTSYNDKNGKGMIWTTSLLTAEFYARRFKNDGKIYQAECRKKHILMVKGEGDGLTINVDTRNIRNISLYKNYSQQKKTRISSVSD